MRTFVPVFMGLALLVGCGGKTEPSCSPAKEIATSSIVKNGDTWEVAIGSTPIEAPVDKVFEAANHPEKGHDLVPDSIQKSELTKDEGNTKVVDVVARLDILPPGFKVQNIVTEYQYFPEQKRFTTKSVNFKLADITAEYKFEPSPDGKGTVLKLTEKSKDKSPMLVDSLQKGALCETFAIQTKVLRRAVGLDGDAKPAS